MFPYTITVCKYTISDIIRFYLHIRGTRTEVTEESEIFSFVDVIKHANGQCNNALKRCSLFFPRHDIIFSHRGIFHRRSMAQKHFPDSENAIGDDFIIFNTRP